MDHICPDEEVDLGFQRFIDDQFDKLVQNFIDFENTILPPSSTNPTNVQDLIDPFDELENTMSPPCQFDSKNAQTFDWEFNGEIEDSEIIITERTEPRIENSTVTSLINGGGGAIGSLTKCTNVTTYPCGDSGGGGGCSSSGGRGGSGGLCMNYANVTTYGAGIRGVVDGSFMNAWRHIGLNVTAMVQRRRRRKRKYRGVYESEAEAARRTELLKIKNRVAATRSYEKKQAYEVQLKAQIQKLQKENEFHKKLLKFLKGNPIDLKQKQLKRTASGPI